MVDALRAVPPRTDTEIAKKAAYLAEIEQTFHAGALMYKTEYDRLAALQIKHDGHLVSLTDAISELDRLVANPRWHDSLVIMARAHALATVLGDKTVQLCSQSIIMQSTMSNQFLVLQNAMMAIGARSWVEEVRAGYIRTAAMAAAEAADDDDDNANNNYGGRAGWRSLLRINGSEQWAGDPYNDPGDGNFAQTDSEPSLSESERPEILAAHPHTDSEPSLSESEFPEILTAHRILMANLGKGATMSNLQVGAVECGVPDGIAQWAHDVTDAVPDAIEYPPAAALPTETAAAAAELLPMPVPGWVGEPMEAEGSG